MTGAIRAATVKDVEQINDIANWYIENTTINFDTTPWSIEKRTDWINQFCRADSPYHILVYERDENIIGFACNTLFRPKAAYNSSTETTVYIAHGIESRGRGGKLYRCLLDLVRERQFHRAYAVITLPNAPSIRLHEKLGFTSVGVFDEAGKKFGKFHNVGIYQKKFQLHNNREQAK